MKKNSFLFLSTSLFLMLLLSGCSGGGGSGSDSSVEESDTVDGGGNVGATNSEYIILAWNDLGMHCLNPTYDQAVILPPYNTVWAQVIRRGTPPAPVTSNLTVEYRVVNNTYSDSKRSYGQFWTYATNLFGIDLPVNTGLNLSDPNHHNGLTGTMVAAGDHFEAHGIPLTPVDDAMAWNPYQVIELTLKNDSGAELAVTRATIPTSDEINCGKCHDGDPNPFVDILRNHDSEEGTSLESRAPVLCAECHGSPALGSSGPGSSGKYLSEAIHGYHASKGATCYDCHPGSQTQCSRSLAHTAADGNCTTCHGNMATVADSIATNGRIPWLEEPKCVNCHTGVAQVDTGTTLFRNATGHGGIYCAGCHGSPHAMVPSREASDNYQAIQYQDSPKTIGSCGACHHGSKGEGSGEFLQEHGPGGRASACNVCHLEVVSNDTAKWPHHFQWQNR